MNGVFEQKKSHMLKDEAEMLEYEELEEVDKQEKCEDELIEINMIN